MPADLEKSLVIGISSRALFDLEESNQVYEEKGLAEYEKYQLAHEDQILQPGAGFALAEAILALNGKVEGHRPAEVVIASANSPATSLRIFNSIKHHKLDIQRAILSGGTSIAKYLSPFSVDLYLSADEADIRTAMNAGIAAAVIYPTPPEIADPRAEIRIAFDGDAVLFSDEAERIYQEDGFEAFIAHEEEKANEPLPEGPFARLLRTLSVVQKDPAFEKPPIRTALVTARSMPSHFRVLSTLRSWDVHVDEAFFMGGVPKTEILRAFRPHIFFDDQAVHCESASDVVSTARVPFGVKNEEPNKPPTKSKKNKQKRNKAKSA